MHKYSVTAEEYSAKDGTFYGVHAAGCKDLAKRKVIADVNSISEAAQEIANLYGGYGDNGDQPENEAHALLWTSIKSCTKKSGEVR